MNFVSSIRQLSSKSHKLRGELLTVREAVAPDVRFKPVTVDVTADVPARAEVDASGEVVRQLAARPSVNFVLTLRRKTRGWSVSELRKG